MLRALSFRTLTALLVALLATTAAHAERIKDVADVVGVRENQLMGYGLVVGLDGTGDNAQGGSPFTLQSMVSMLERKGVNLRERVGDLDPANVAAVMVTADLPPAIAQGQRIDVTVSSIGDAESLRGGTLLMTPLKGADDKVYAVAQGSMSMGNLQAGQAGQGQVSHLTVGQIPEGALVEREVPTQIAERGMVRLALRQADFTTAARVARRVNSDLGGEYAKATDPGLVKVQVPEDYRDEVVPLVSRLESLTVRTDRKAKVVLDERTGTVIIGDHVRVHPVAISHGNLSLTVSEEPQVSQPASYGDGLEESVPQGQLADGKQANVVMLQPGVRLSKLVGALNAIGAQPGDLVAILRAVKQSGALSAKLEII
jgi:flagellar P-ring protein precursor FlgI